MQRAIVLLSGGLDSTTVLGMALQEHREVYPLSFVYGQRHMRELQAVEKVVSFYSEYQMGLFQRWKIISLPLEVIGGSALTDPSLDVPIDRPPENMTNIPVTYVPARNTIFLAYALGYAEKLNAEKIYVGVNALDYSGYPDCRPEFIKAFNELAIKATKCGVEGKAIQIMAPLIDMTKAQIIKLGNSLVVPVPYHLTSSCYQPNYLGEACGHCDSCILRIQGFENCGLQDPIKYRVPA
jgi:7-cyano-7-deazaguanine synthase